MKLARSPARRLASAITAGGGMTLIQQAIATLRRLASSPAGIFTAGKGYLQTPGNLLTNSNPTWTVVKGATGVGTVTTGQTDPYGGSTAQRIQLTQNTDFALVQTAMPSATGVHTGMMMVRSNTGVSQTIKIWTDNVAAVDVTATTDWAIVAATQNVTANTFFKILSTSTCDVTVARIGVAVGTYTAQQLQAMGGIPLTTSAAAVPVYTNASVYAAGANGAAINSLLSNNYILSDGSTGYSAVDGPVGLVLDGAGSVGSELVTNGDFSAGTAGWTENAGNTAQAVVGGELRLTSTAAGACTSSSPFTTIVGATYKVQALVRCGTTATVGINALATQFGSTIATVSSVSTTNVMVEFYFVATGTTTYIGARLTNSLGAGETGFFDNISVKQVTGIHATQATTANKPTVRRGLLNLLTYSNDLTNAAWLKNGTAAALSASVGNMPANNDYFYEIIPNQTASTPLTIGAVLSGSGTVELSYFNTVDASARGLLVVTLTATPTLYATNLTTAASTGTTYIRVGRVGASYTATSMTVGGMGVFTGTLTAQQILDSGGIPLTTSAAASNPSAGRYSWSFDGGDSLALGSVPFQTSDDHAVIAAYRTNSVGGANAAVAVLSATTGITRNCGIITETGTGKALVTWFDGVTNNQIATAASILGTPVVVSGRKVGASGVGRLNGTQFGTVTVAASLVGTVGFIGSFAGAGQEHNGNISMVIAIKGTLTDAEMLTLERFAAATLPNAPAF